MSNKLEMTVDDIPAVIYDLQDHATWGFAPGFYWRVLLDEEGQPIAAGEIDAAMLIGPFDTTDLAYADLCDFIQDCSGVQHPELKDAA